MKIKLDKKHYLISEPDCCWIVCETKSKSGLRAARDCRKRMTLPESWEGTEDDK